MTRAQPAGNVTYANMPQPDGVTQAGAWCDDDADITHSVVWFKEKLTRGVEVSVDGMQTPSGKVSDVTISVLVDFCGESATAQQARALAALLRAADVLDGVQPIL